LREEFYKDVFVPGSDERITTLSWKKRLRVADFFELGELMVLDALTAMNLVAVTSVKNTSRKG
jgi:succinate dehydrogenase / fumarate reductase flavoprotein subunit